MDTLQVPLFSLVIKTSTERESMSGTWPAVGWILALGMAAHGLLLFTDYVIWDGWWIQAFLRRPDDWDNFYRIFSEAGRNLDIIWYFPLLGQSACVSISKSLSVLCWIAAAVLVFWLLLCMRVCSKKQAFMIAALGVTLPLYDVLGDLNSLSFTIPVPLFYAGWLLLVVADKFRGWRAILLQAISAVLFLASFTLPSLLVLFYAVLALWILKLTQRELNWSSFWRAYAKQLWQKAPFLILPLSFWLIKGKLWPAHGVNASYNSVVFDGRQFVEVYWSLVQTLFRVPVNLVYQHAWLAITAVVIAVVSSLVLRPTCLLKNDSASDSKGMPLALVGLILLVACAFPYAMVHQPFAADGWWTRCNVLLNFPVALLVVGALTWLQDAFFRGSKEVLLLPGRALVCAGIGANILNYASYQGFGAKQLAVQRVLVKVEQEFHPRIIQLRDYWQIQGTIPWYPPSIWSFIAADGKTCLQSFVVDTRMFAADQIVQSADGQASISVPFPTIADDSLSEMVVATLMPYLYRISADRHRQVLVVIPPGSTGGTSANIGLDYLRLKYFEPEKLANFVTQLFVPYIKEGP